MAKKTQLVKIKDPNCLNCGYPFSGYEIFCPECGQKNKGDKLTFGSFIKEIFNGFISWDAKFWKTIIPLIVNPGKVSKDYIEGKRNRYANPFRFYVSISLIFFLLLGINYSYLEYKNLKEGGLPSKSSFIVSDIQEGWDSAGKEIDSINKLKKEKLLIKDSISNTKDTVTTKKKGFFLNVAGEEVPLKKLLKFNKKHPTLNTDLALDSLKMKKKLWNRFWYSRASLINSFTTDKGISKKIEKQLFSYMSIALFIMLPLFTLFLKLIYIRRKYTYVEHLVFVFHIQTVFFLLLILFTLLSFFSYSEYYQVIFLVTFLIYLFLAMKKFYNQGFFKTLLKYILVNSVYIFISIFGFLIVALLAFALF